MKIFFKYYLINKLLLISNFKNIQEILILKKIILQFGFKNQNLIKNSKKILSGCLFLNLLINIKSVLIKSKKSVMILKIRQGMVVSVKVILRNNFMYFFLNRFLLINFFKLGGIFLFNSKSISNCTMTVRISDLYIFPEIERFFDFCEDLPYLSFTISSNENLKKNSIKNFKIFLSFLGIIK